MSSASDFRPYPSECHDLCELCGEELDLGECATLGCSAYETAMGRGTPAEDVAEDVRLDGLYSHERDLRLYLGSDESDVPLLLVGGVK
jgi:hypothetical protein